MKKLLLLLAFLLLLAAWARPARAQTETKMVFFIETVRERDLIEGYGEKPQTKPFRALLAFRPKEVRLNLDGSGPDHDLVYPVQTIRLVSRRHQTWVWECADRTFTLDIRRNLVRVLYRASTYETTYGGTLQSR